MEGEYSSNIHQSSTRVEKKQRKVIYFQAFFSKQKSRTVILRYKTLKGHRHEIFGYRVFMQFKPVWVGGLETRPKKSIFYGLGLKIGILYFLVRLYF
jgi:hypothetical protein